MGVYVGGDVGVSVGIDVAVGGIGVSVGKGVSDVGGVFVSTTEKGSVGTSVGDGAQPVTIRMIIPSKINDLLTFFISHLRENSIFMCENQIHN